MERRKLTDEQKKFMEECEEELKDRYTEKDSKFMKVKNMGVIKPPIIDLGNREHRSSYDRYERFSYQQGYKKQRRNNERQRYN